MRGLLDLIAGRGAGAGDAVYHALIDTGNCPCPLLSPPSPSCCSEVLMVHTPEPKVVCAQVVKSCMYTLFLVAVIARIFFSARPSPPLTLPPPPPAGALITGMSNHEVAAYLLARGLAWCEGVVFLDEAGRTPPEGVCVCVCVSVCRERERESE